MNVTDTSLRDLAARAAEARREVWREKEEREATEKCARHHAEMRRNAERFLAPYLLERACHSSTGGDLTLDLGDGILLSYEPRRSGEYGPAGERFFLAEKCIACGDVVRGVEVASGHEHGSLATLGEALAAGVDLTRCPCLIVDEDEEIAATPVRKTTYAHALEVTDHMLIALDAAEDLTALEQVAMAAQVAQALWLAEIRDALYRLGGER